MQIANCYFKQICRLQIAEKQKHTKERDTAIEEFQYNERNKTLLWSQLYKLWNLLRARRARKSANTAVLPQGTLCTPLSPTTLIRVVCVRGVQRVPCGRVPAVKKTAPAVKNLWLKHVFQQKAGQSCRALYLELYELRSVYFFVQRFDFASCWFGLDNFSQSRAGESDYEYGTGHLHPFLVCHSVHLYSL